MGDRKGTFVVTGCRGGLGKTIAAHFLASPWAEVYKGEFGVRNPSDAPELRQLLESSKQPEHEIIQLDLSTLDAVHSGAKDINERVQAGRIPRIRALVLNAAMQQVSGQDFTKDGLERTFAVNYLANFLLAVLLLPSMDKDVGRIVILGSWTHDPSHPMNGFITDESHKTIIKDLDNLAKPRESDKPEDLYNSGMRRYGMSKTLLITIMYELQRRISASKEYSNVCVLSVDPGAMTGTDLFRNSPAWLKFFLQWGVGSIVYIWNWWSPNGYFRPTSKSALDVCNASFSQVNIGKYPKGVYLNGSEIIESSPETKDEMKQRELWDFSVKLTGLKQSDTVIGIR